MGRYSQALLVPQPMLLRCFERFEGKLDSYKGNLLRAAVELAKEWRTDKILRRLEALLIVADKEHILIISGNW